MPTYEFEDRHGRQQGRLIAGCDEAGRGPLAGPVVAAAVIIPAIFPAVLAKQLDDSKKLSAKARAALYPAILQHCPSAIALADVNEIDSINILQASLLAMARAVESLQGRSKAGPSYILPYEGAALSIDAVLVDGNKLPKLSCKAEAVVGGDARSLSIAAASILAKVARDQLMHDLHLQYPTYGFEKHAGYGTPDHLAALRLYGPCPQHRQSFAPVRECDQRRAG